MKTNIQKESIKLELKIKEATGWNKARVFVIVGLIIAIIKLGRVNLKKVAPLINPLRSKKTNYRRLNKFFQYFKTDISIVSKLMSSFLPKEKWVLTMDRTNWRFGEKDINILMLAVAYKGIAIPLMWSILKERGRGNSSYRDRIRIMRKFINIFGIDKIEILVADREFIGKEWFKWLKKRKVPFTIRIKGCHRVKTAKGERRIDSLFSYLQVGKYSLYGKKKRIHGYDGLYIVALKLEDEYLILATNSNQYKALKMYKKRWEIETLFSSLKSRGFNLEETHMSKDDKIYTLISILSIAFVWCHIIGEWMNEQQPLKVLKHGYKEKSLFLYGLETLADIFLNYEFRKKQLIFAFSVLNFKDLKIGD